MARSEHSGPPGAALAPPPERVGVRTREGWPGRIVATLSRAAGALASLVLVLLAAYILLEIGLRAVRGTGTNVLVEFIGYGLAALTFLGASATMRDGGMVRVAIVLERLPAGARRLLDVLCILCGLLSVGLLAWFVGADLLRSFDRGYETDSIFALPQWVPPLPMFVGMIVFLLDMLAQLVGIVARGHALPTESPDVI
jgi:TRAP-type C4-dicarboxylate transport system permease small subunit